MKNFLLLTFILTFICVPVQASDESKETEDLTEGIVFFPSFFRCPITYAGWQLQRCKPGTIVVQVGIIIHNDPDSPHFKHIPLQYLTKKNDGDKIKIKTQEGIITLRCGISHQYCRNQKSFTETKIRLLRAFAKTPNCYRSDRYRLHSLGILAEEGCLRPKTVHGKKGFKLHEYLTENNHSKTLLHRLLTRHRS
ncbi:MAG TPA: hypothetical protein VGT41_02985 [Candidatus Babeliales bacterium]|nr:hypothetical protein [Candidatus Babeliales bacterium]